VLGSLVLGAFAIGCGAPAPVACPPEHTLRESHAGTASTFECVDAAGALDGPRLRVMDGTPIWRQEWRSGQLHGRMSIYERGLLASSTEWNEGVLDGLAEGFHPDGSLMWSGTWRRGAPDGRFGFHRPFETLPKYSVELAKGDLVWSDHQQHAPLSSVVPDGSARVVAGVRMEGFDNFFDGAVPVEGELAYGLTSATEGYPIGVRASPELPWNWAVPFAVLERPAPPAD
jgi:hypothetical protein